uniref:Uncharacterized protein n=1 Tax=Zea mays TaxID=4577 RepID=C4J071_MAIZE|nr:unknown [Zea mays]
MSLGPHLSMLGPNRTSSSPPPLRLGHRKSLGLLRGSRSCPTSRAASSAPCSTTPSTSVLASSPSGTHHTFSHHPSIAKELLSIPNARHAPPPTMNGCFRFTKTMARLRQGASDSLPSETCSYWPDEGRRPLSDPRPPLGYC